MLKPSELLSQPGNWCQGAFAENAQGFSVDALHEDAVRWCALGGIDKCAIDEEHKQEMIEKLKTHLYGAWESVSCWNDHAYQTQENVVQAFKLCGL